METSEYNIVSIYAKDVCVKRRGLIRSWRRTYGHLEN